MTGDLATSYQPSARSPKITSCEVLHDFYVGYKVSDSWFDHVTSLRKIGVVKTWQTLLAQPTDRVRGVAGRDAG